MNTSKNSPHSSGNNRYDNKVGTGCLGPQDDTPYSAPSLQDKHSNLAYQVKCGYEFTIIIKTVKHITLPSYISGF